jgi:hypothetical protein
MPLFLQIAEKVEAVSNHRRRGREEDEEEEVNAAMAPLSIAQDNQPR